MNADEHRLVAGRAAGRGDLSADYADESRLVAGLVSQGVALGWYVPPFQGSGHGPSRRSGLPGWHGHLARGWRAAGSCRRGFAALTAQRPPGSAGGVAVCPAMCTVP